MKINNFEEIIGWQKGQELAVWVYQTFGSLRDFSFKDQICRASVSVSNNVAEGFDRGSDRDFLKFLFIARASASEVKSIVYLAQKLNFIDEPTKTVGISKCDDVGKLLNGFITSLLKSNPGYGQTDKPTN